VKADRAKLLESSTVVTNNLREELTENTRYYTGRLNEAGATIGTFKDKLVAAQAKNQRLQNDLNSSQAQVAELRSQLETERTSREPIETELAKLAADREELAQLKKWTKEAAAELHREERSMELEKVRWQRELSDARAELADAKATMLVQSNKIRELERGYSFKPNPAESRLRMEIGELRSQLETERALREEITNLAPIAIGVEFPDAAKILSQLRTKRKKSPVSLADIEAILEIIEES
jgi:chromosome segregation ATPase